MGIKRSIVQVWHRRGVAAYALWPLSMLYRGVIALRRWAYRTGLITVHRFDTPIIVVGNITVGGTGKTPVVAAITSYLLAEGYKPGIVSRGYGGRAGHWPQSVNAVSSPAEVGDEPVLLARRTGCPVVVGPDRPAAVSKLLQDYRCDVVISDDGLQHLALHRDIEIVVVDIERQFGNGFCLPAGPLREPRERLRSVNFVLSNGGSGAAGFQLTGEDAVNVADHTQVRPLAGFVGIEVHALAAIGNPDRFFNFLRAHGLDITEHAFTDHHGFSPADLAFAVDKVVIMTEKDEVKCAPFATENMWYVPVNAELDNSFYNQLTKLLEAI